MSGRSLVGTSGDVSIGSAVSGLQGQSGSIAIQSGLALDG